MSVSAQIAAVDLFCGVGGLTHGLTRSGVGVRLGIDLDPACRFPMEENNAAEFMEADVAKVMPEALFSGKALRWFELLALAGETYGLIELQT